MNHTKTVLAAALSTAMGLSVATAAEAAIINASFDGLFTLLDPAGVPVQNVSNPYYYDPTWGYGQRSQISGTFQFDTSTGFGTAVVNPFQFFSGGNLTVHDITLQAIGDGFGGAGTLVAGAMLLDWLTTANTNVGIVLDAAGFFGSLPAGSSTTISGVGAIPASNGIKSGAYPIGPAPMATTTWNTNFEDNPGCVMTASCLTSNDAIGGDPMDNGPFPGFSANLDITSIHIEEFIMVPPPPVPVPAAAWLFGSGLFGLVGVARRRKRC